MSAHDRLDRIESKLATTTDAPILTDQERALLAHDLGPGGRE